jgi:hypothetical protein
MKVQNQQLPLKGVSPHGLYDPEFTMYIVVGHSASLRFVMGEALTDEIQRGLIWFLGSLLGGVAIFFVIFSFAFER